MTNPFIGILKIKNSSKPDPVNGYALFPRPHSFV